MNKYFTDKNLKPTEVKAILLERDRLNCYQIAFKLNDNSLVTIGPFSGETYNELVTYWTTVNNQ